MELEVRFCNLSHKSNLTLILTNFFFKSIQIISFKSYEKKHGIKPLFVAPYKNFFGVTVLPSKKKNKNHIAKDKKVMSCSVCDAGQATCTCKRQAAHFYIDLDLSQFSMGKDVVDNV